MSIIPDKIFDRLEWEEITDRQLQEIAVDMTVCDVDLCGNLTDDGVIMYLKGKNGDIIAVHFLYVPGDVQEFVIFMAKIPKRDRLVKGSIEESVADKPPVPPKQAKKSYGEFGWVKLTDDEYNRLLKDLGEAEVKRCIAYVDESAQTTNNKNKWRDWNLVVRKCSRDGWGLRNSAYKQNQAQNYASSADRLAEMIKRGDFND